MEKRSKIPSAPGVGVKVTQQHIDESTRKDSSHCMIADAVYAAVPGAQFVSVDLQMIRFSKDDFRYTYFTPRKAQVELIRFDQGLQPEPFEFQLRAGQTTRRRRKNPDHEPQPRTEAQQAATEKAMAVSPKPFGARERARM